MKGNKTRPAGSLGRTLRLATVTLVALIATGPACLNRPVQPVDVHTTSTIIEKLPNSGVDKIDVLLAIDNSRSMADKEQILNTAVPDLVNRLVSPICVDKAGVPQVPQTTNCGAGFAPEFPAITDIHIAVVSSSLGSFGGNACVDVDTASKDCPGAAGNPEGNDHGELITRADPCNLTKVATYNGDKGFLAWDPMAKYTPAGIANVADLTTSITQLVTGTGQIGCGFESQNEGWYRFLVDPAPYQTIGLQTISNATVAVPQGMDTVLLQQRKDFLRPDSLLAIVMLTDENDGSAIEGNQYYIVEDAPHLPPARSECATDPNNPCCRSCAQSQMGCPTDANCALVGNPPQFVTPLNGVNDNFNQRMFDNKRRFGIDFLYPYQRYVNALTQTYINPASFDLSIGNGTPVLNPIFSDLQNSGATIRTADLVFLAGIVGVVWQDIAVDPKDLTKGFKDFNALNTPDDSGHTGWDVILGDPSNYVPPLDPHMIEQFAPRTGTDPVTMGMLQPTTAAEKADPINGHEYTVTPAGSDLQYACIFELPTPRNCALGATSCDCGPMAAPDNPLCVANPADNGNRTLQKYAKGYPGTRHLQILKGLGPQGIVASVCPVQTSDTNASDYGYRPAVAAIINRLKTKLSGQCLPRTLTPDKSGQAPCVIIAARRDSSGGACCDPAKGRVDVDPSHKQAQAAAAADPTNPKINPWNCFCEIPQAEGDDLTACQNEINDPPNVNAWCYIDATTFPPTGNVDLLSKCDAEDQREIRLVSKGNVNPQEVAFINCSNSGN